jgi:membrane-associated phospholipid phosphatase
MPFFSGNSFFVPLLLVGAILLLWKGGARGRICVLMLVLIVPLGESLVINTLKHVLQRPRPFLTLADVHIPDGIGRTGSGSMPSAHAANWFAATMIAFIYYRRSIQFMLPMAALVGFSRIYNGVHYPSDVLVGAILGAGYAACGVWTLDALWQRIGRRWFPLWWERLPSLLNPALVAEPRNAISQPASLDQHWLRLGYVLIFIQLAANLAYIGSGVITLSPDEAYQWIWSKHLALSYYSKPPIIALIQFAGTHLWGDTPFGVRFFAPVIGAITSICLLRFLARVANVRAAFWLSVILPMVPLISVGWTLMTIDPPSVMFWLLTMIAGWRAVQDDSTTRDWFWVGLWMGLGFLSKYHSLFQLLSWALFFVLFQPARKQLRRPGPYVALLVNLVCTIPVLIWNSRNHWITIKHVSEGGHFDEPWAFTLANLWHGLTKYTSEFVGAEFLLQNPFFFLPVVWTAMIFWREKPRQPLLVYFFSMAAPLVFVYFLLSFHSRVLPNWIAHAIPPLLCLAVVYWEARWRNGAQPLKFWLVGGMILGLVGAVILRNTDIIPKIAFGYSLPATLDSTRRVKGWAETAQVVEEARQKLMAEGKPVFIIGDHYGITGELTFNLREAKAGLPDHPLVYFHTSDVPLNQFYFWPGYHDRKGQNALYVTELDLSVTNLYTVPAIIYREFESVTNSHVVISMRHGQPMHKIEITECRGLR